MFSSNKKKKKREKNFEIAEVSWLSSITEVTLQIQMGIKI
jgi:hypothetical protein